MALPRIIKNFNAFLDGTSYFGLVEEGKLPAVKIQTEAHRGSGMDGPVGLDVGMEGMTAELTFSEWLPAVIGKLGRQERIVLRPAKASATDFTASPVIATMTGLITTSEHHPPTRGLFLRHSPPTNRHLMAAPVPCRGAPPKR